MNTKFFKPLLPWALLIASGQTRAQMGFNAGMFMKTQSTECLAGSQSFTTPGDYTWTVPQGSCTIVVKVWGGGGNGSSHLDNTFRFGYLSKFNGTQLVANGGGNGTYNSTSGGTGSGGDINLTGGDGGPDSNSYTTNATGGNGGSAPAGGGAGGVGTKYGASTSCSDGSAPGGGGGSGAHDYGGGEILGEIGGGAGGYAQKTYGPGALAPGASISLTVGAGGISACFGGLGKGGDGKVQIDWTP